ncbi:vWA domain-containing protein [Arundinibacter roseus]|uniref:VWA domain-containing protein n=1 Tax=Arundinibacter roseus TaxID=2070510 RepID=A0A4R4KFX5_9BACT|nr:VWA domain-containing protein [Arundinibacter roseus]TDB66924.1 VWA domain-containing protein [Arundinibacter roseus]
MNWNYPFGTTEIIFSILFIFVYITYVFRTIRIARKLKTTARSLFLKFFIRSIAFVLLMISLLGPSFGEAERELKATGKDVYILVDLSKSMDATDVSPTRLEKIKFEINRLLAATVSNRYGLIVFSNDAYTQSPLTYDQAALGLYVQSMQTNLLPTSGTNPCSALELAYTKMTRDSSAANKSKILILFTDGEKPANCKAYLFNNLRRFGFRILIVGVGTSSGSSIRTGDGFLKDSDGETVISKLNDKALSSLAMQTKGTVYRLNNQVNDIAKVVEEVNSLEGQLIDSRRVAIVTNKYYYFLIVALALLFLDVLITVRTFRL